MTEGGVGTLLDGVLRAMEAGDFTCALRLLQKGYPLARGWVPAVLPNAARECSASARSVRVQRNGRLFAGGRDWFTECDGAVHVADQVNANPVGGQYVLRQSPTHTALVAPRTRRLLSDRPAALIGSSGNYYHWLLDYLPRVPLVSDAGLPLLVGSTLAPFESESLAGLGIRRERLVAVPPASVTAFTRLHVPDIGSLERRPHPETVEWLRATFVGGRGPHRRLWVSRVGARTRRLVNEVAIVDALRPLGFCPVLLDGLGIREQADLFAGAEVIAGPHGAGFANAVFSAPGTALVEIAAETPPPIFFGALAGGLGLRHRTLKARPVQGEAAGLHPRDWDMEVEPGAVVAAIRGL